MQGVEDLPKVNFLGKAKKKHTDMKKERTQEQTYLTEFKEEFIAIFPNSPEKLKNACIYATSEITGLSIGKLIDKDVLVLKEYKDAAEFALNAKYKQDREKIQEHIDRKFFEVHGVGRNPPETKHIFSGNIRE